MWAAKLALLVNLLVILGGCATTGERTLHYTIPYVEYEQYEPVYQPLP